MKGFLTRPMTPAMPYVSASGRVVRAAGLRGSRRVRASAWPTRDPEAPPEADEVGLASNVPPAAQPASCPDHESSLACSI